MIGGYLSVVSSNSIKGPVVSLSKKLYSNCLVLVGSRNGFEPDVNKQKNACFTINNIMELVNNIVEFG